MCSFWGGWGGRALCRGVNATAPVRLGAAGQHRLALGGRILPGSVAAASPFGGQERAAGSSTSDVLARARLAAFEAGVDLQAPYEPNILVDLLQQGVVNMHGMLGDPTLAVVTMGLLWRVATWPFNRRSLQKQCDRVELAPIYAEYLKALAAATSRGQGGTAKSVADVTRAKEDHEAIKGKFNEFVRATRFMPLQGLGYHFAALLPIFGWAFLGMRGIAEHPDAFRTFVTTSSMWLDSLVLADPYGILPVLSAAGILFNAEINRPNPQPGREEEAEYIRFVMRGAALTFVPVTQLLPSAMLVFMATNSFYTAIVTYFFRQRLWRRPYIDPNWVLPDHLKAPGGAPNLPR